MNGGSRFLTTAAVVALTGCGGSQAKLEIRSTPTPLSATARPVPFRIAEANNYLALGNVGLAVESFRKALREQPDSIDAMVGLASSYEQMNRFDLSRRYYESALAIAPKDSRILTAFAQSLEKQGSTEEATAVRHEIGMRLAASKPSPATAAPTPTREAVIVREPIAMASSSVTVALPPARPVAAAPLPKARPIAIAAVQTAAAPKAPQPAPRVEPKAASKPPVAAPAIAAPKTVQMAAAPMPAPTPRRTAPAIEVRKATPAAALPTPAAPVVLARKVQEPKAAPAPSTVAPTVVARQALEAPSPKPAPPVVLPPVVAGKVLEAAVASLPSVAAPAVVAIRMVEAAAAASAPAPGPTVTARKLVSDGAQRLSPGLHLERMSPGVVALVTTGRPQWRSTLVNRTPQSATIRFVPLRTATARPVQIRLLNAARQQGLAARTRSVLAQRGWRQLAIGDALRPRRTSLILYPERRLAMAKRLGAQFGMPIAKRASGTELVMLIGRDRAGRNFGRSGG